MIAAGCTEGASTRFRSIGDWVGTDRFGTETSPLNETALRVQYKQLLWRKRESPRLERVYHQTYAWLRPRLTQQILHWMDYHLNPDSLVFQTLFSQLNRDMAGSIIYQRLMQHLWGAFRFSVIALVHYAHIQPFRGPDEVVYANVFFDPQLHASVSEKDFMATLTKLDAKLTQLLKAHLKAPSAAYARNHLVNFKIVTDRRHDGFFNSRSQTPIHTFVTADIPRAASSIPLYAYSLSEERDAFAGELSAPSRPCNHTTEQAHANRTDGDNDVSEDEAAEHRVNDEDRRAFEARRIAQEQHTQNIRHTIEKQRDGLMIQSILGGGAAGMLTFGGVGAILPVGFFTPFIAAGAGVALTGMAVAAAVGNRIMGFIDPAADLEQELAHHDPNAAERKEQRQHMFRQTVQTVVEDAQRLIGDTSQRIITYANLSST